MKKIILFLCIPIALCFAGACRHASDKVDITAPPPAEELYNNALDLYKDNNYMYALDAFQKVRARYPISNWGIRSELLIADCLYYQKKYENAFVQYQEFTRLHPVYQFIDYAYYQIGMCYYKQLCTIDRDQTFTRQALRQFERLHSLFPSSPYIPSAVEKINECRQMLGEHILYIGNYYYRTGAYNSAFSRFLEVRHDYSGYLSSPDLLMFQLGKTYLHLNEPENAREQFTALLQEYPESPYAPLCEDLLEDPKKIEDIDKIKISKILKKVNPIRAIKSIPLPFIERNKEPD